MKTKESIEHIVLKATSMCNAYCYHCRNRQILYDEVDADHYDLSLDAAKAILDFFKRSRIKKITITGGEPTTARGLLKLTKLASKYAPNITLITNGWNNQESYWRQLIENGITHVDISIDGYDAGLHDWIRNRRGLFKRAIGLMDLFDKCSSEYPRFGYSIITIVNNFNLLKLDLFLDFIFSHNVCRWILHYPEADLDSIFSPSLEKQYEFRRSILLKIKEIFAQKIADENTAQNANETVEKLYNPYEIDCYLASKSIYHKSKNETESCPILGKSILVKYHAKIYGCIGGDYSEEARVGSYDNARKRIIFDELSYKSVLDSRIDYCTYCPVPKTLRIILK